MSVASEQKSAQFHSAADSLSLRCPACHKAIGQVKRISPAIFDNGHHCASCPMQIRNQRGIWTALVPEREAYFRQFMLEYQLVRAAEGRGSNTAAYYLALPFRDVTGHNQQQWSIRAHSFRYLEKRILPEFENSMPALDVLDLGAGNGWLDYRLTLRGHRPVAVDLLTNGTDGLGAASHYLEQLPTLFPRFQAEFNRLPFADAQFDCAIFNASFHYSENYAATLAEVIRCLRPGGWIVIADSPWYSKEENGRRMVEERHLLFLALHGFASNSVKSQEYLTDEKMHALASRFGLNWRVHRPYYGLRWSLRPVIARLKGKREPSEFRIYVARVPS
ncbi:MAG TPA: class I SAM-dependent methyltransferase [Terriglobales bacterium]|nr:class I SAM-dependent methyltransferase [Terriglobales bacterium]